MHIRTPFVTMLFIASLYACSESTSNDKDTLNVSTEGYTSIDSGSLKDDLERYALGELTLLESEGLLFLREEEKLADNLNGEFSDTWKLDIFERISSSESTHSNAINVLIKRYFETDPAKNLDDGEFSNQELQSLYSELYSEGSESLLDALKVSCAVAELSLIDLQVLSNRLEANDDLSFVYEQLLLGSRNHLRALVKTIETQDDTYTPRYLTMEEYDVIIAAEIELPTTE